MGKAAIRRQKLIFIDWNDVVVSRRLNDGDVITASFSSPSAANQTEYLLELAPHISWWKGLQVIDNNDQDMGLVEIEGGGGTSSQVLSLRTSDIQVGAKLVLLEGQMFGIHTPMYILADLEQHQDELVTFRWSADG